MTPPKRRIFLTVRGSSGLTAAETLVKAWVTAQYGSQKDFWLYSRDSVPGVDLYPEFLDQLHNSHFYVPVITPDFTSTTSPYVEAEIKAAVAIEERLQKTFPGYRFILPYFADGATSASLPQSLQSRVGGDAIRVAQALHEAIETNEGSHTFRANPRSLDEWPDRLLDDPKVMFVLGHTQKEGKLDTSRLRDFAKMGLDGDLEKSTVYQSLRPAQMVPHLQRHLHDLWLARRTGAAAAPLPRFECELDKHLINYRASLLPENNLICLGAGDTNWISRALQTYYRNVLLEVRFNEQGSSHAIVVTRDHQDGKAGKLSLADARPTADGRLEYSLITAEPDDAQYNAIILAVPNPWNPEKTAILCAGLTGLGTLAAMFALMDPAFKDRIKGRALPHVTVIKGIERDWLPVGYEVIY
jgi:hypothetical protein